MNVCTTDDFTKSVDALVYYIDPENEECKIAYPNLLFDRNIIDGRGMMCSVLALDTGGHLDLCDVAAARPTASACRRGPVVLQTPLLHPP